MTAFTIAGVPVFPAAIEHFQPDARLPFNKQKGLGEPLLLLARMAIPDVFDDFAPRLTDGFRVFAITRRGFGASSQPTPGYDLASMVEDIARVTDTLKLGRVEAHRLEAASKVAGGITALIRRSRLTPWPRSA